MTRTIAITIGALAAATIAAALPAAAGALPPIMLTTQLGWMEARPDMFRSANDGARTASPNGYYAVSGDFDGDGRTDEARILIKRDGKKGMLVIVLNRVGYQLKTYGFETMKATMLGNVGIKLAAPGNYTLAKPDGAVTTKTVGTDAVMLFRFGGPARIYTFNGEDFTGTDVMPG